MKQNNLSKMTPRLTDISENTPEAKARMKIMNKRVEDNLVRLVSGRTNHVEKTEIRNASGKVTKTFTKTIPSKLNLEACKFLLDRYGAQDKKAAPKRKAKR